MLEVGFKLFVLILALEELDAVLVSDKSGSLYKSLEFSIGQFFHLRYERLLDVDELVKPIMQFFFLVGNFDVLILQQLPFSPFCARYGANSHRFDHF